MADMGLAHAADAVGGESHTTLLIRNLPRRFTSQELVAELLLYVSPRAFDYVYVPWDRKGTNNVGYAFVNFVDASLASDAAGAMEGRPWRIGSRTRPVKVQPAHVQGLKENLERFIDQDGAVDEAHAPLLFRDGEPTTLEDVLREEPACGAATSPSCGDGGGPSPATTFCGDDAPESPWRWLSASSQASDSEDAADGPWSVPLPAPIAAAMADGAPKPSWPRAGAPAAPRLRAPPGLENLIAPAAVAAAPFRPPPGLEDIVAAHSGMAAGGVAAPWSPDDAARHEEVGLLIQKLLNGGRWAV